MGLIAVFPWWNWRQMSLEWPM